MNKRKVYPGYFVLGALIIYLVFMVIPGLIGIGFSFTDWSAYTDELNFVGWENFKTIFSPEENYVKVISNTLVSTLIVGMVFTSILNPAEGLLNVTLRSIGLDALALPWLTSSQYAFGTVMAVDIWKGTGYIMTVLIAGLMSISPTYYEAADIDSANGFQKLRYITLPLLMPTLATTTVMNVIYGLKVFDMIYALTNGGPGKATTEVLYTEVFKRFGTGQYAVGTALSSVMFVFMVIIGIFMIRVMTKDEVVE